MNNLLITRKGKTPKIPFNCIANGLSIGYAPSILTDLNEVELSILTLLPTQKHVFSVMAGVHKGIKGWHTMHFNNIEYTNGVLNYFIDHCSNDEQQPHFVTRIFYLRN